MRITKRLDELEGRAFGRTITLTMPDGRKVGLPARRLEAAVRCALQHQFDDPDVLAVLDSVSDDCALCGQGHLGDLIRVMAHAASGPPVGADALDRCEETVIQKEVIQ